jgi:hypothetical protein
VTFENFKLTHYQFEAAAEKAKKFKGSARLSCGSATFEFEFEGKKYKIEL